MFAIEEFLDDGEDVLARYPDFTLLTHRVCSLSCVMDIPVIWCRRAKGMPRARSAPICQASAWDGFPMCERRTNLLLLWMKTALSLLWKCDLFVLPIPLPPKSVK